jgi:hypothetical protein
MTRGGGGAPDRCACIGIAARTIAAIVSAVPAALEKTGLAFNVVTSNTVNICTRARRQEFQPVSPGRISPGNGRRGTRTPDILRVRQAL